MIQLRRFWLLVPAATMLAVDVALTLAGQPTEYWAGNYAAAVEMNPFAFPILAHSPLAFVSLALV